MLWSTWYLGPKGALIQLRMSYGNVTTTTLASEVGAADFNTVLADEFAAYWTDLYVEKYTF